MRLYIVRHAKANDAQAGGDFERELTARGEAQARFLAGKMQHAGAGIKVIITSRLPRALQTAHAIHRGMGCGVRTDGRLEVDRPVSDALAVIREHAQDRSVMLVGHNPQLGELLGMLCSGLPPQELILKTGELVVLDIRPEQPIGSGKLVDRGRMSDPAPGEDTLSGAVESVTSRSR